MRNDRLEADGMAFRRLSHGEIKSGGMRNYNEKWTKEDIDKALEMYFRGYSVRIIALALGRSHHAVQVRINAERRKRRKEGQS